MSLMDRIRNSLYAARNAKSLLSELYELRNRNADLEAANEHLKHVLSESVKENLQLISEQATAMRSDEKEAVASTVMPVGRIDYLGFNGSVYESIEYHDEKQFIDTIREENYYGVPMAITVYTDAKNGSHIDTAWRFELDPPPQGFNVTPYQEPTPETAVTPATPVQEPPNLEM